MKKLCFVLLLLLLPAGLNAATTEITRHGVTFTLDGTKTTGTFANGDYWVVGPVTITAITPDYVATAITIKPAPATPWEVGDVITGQTSNATATIAQVYSSTRYRYTGLSGTFISDEIVGVTGVPAKLADQSGGYPRLGGINGWQVNPLVSTTQGFDHACVPEYYRADLVPSLPYTTSLASESIVKTVTSGLVLPCLKTAVVLTVLPSVPANNGATVFRPPYSGISKPLYNTGDLRTDLLPSLASVGTPPSLATVASQFQYLRLEHTSGTSSTRRDLRPSDAYYDYAPSNSPVSNEAFLRLMLNDSVEDKMAALIAVTQHGIDQAHIFIDGWDYAIGGGHDPGHRIFGAFAATMLDITAAKTALLSAHSCHEDSGIYRQVGKNGVSLWGNPSSESQYWGYIRGLGGSRSNRDPYGFIDGGTCGDDYQVIIPMSWKGSVLVASLMPEIQAAWPSSSFQDLQNYMERWVSAGVWSQPDPCAPYTVGGVYGVDYGPDPANPGKCILDTDLVGGSTYESFSCQVGQPCGRYPAKHGTEVDWGQYRSAFMDAMWNAYYAPDVFSYLLTITKAGAGSGTVTSDVTGINCGPSCSASYTSGTPVVLTASVAGGNVFTGWSGEGCSGTGECSVTLDAARNVTATFTPATTNWNVIVSHIGTGSGTTIPTVGSTLIAEGAATSVVATAGLNSVFTAWTGTCACADPTSTTCAFTMPASDCTAIADFTDTYVSSPLNTGAQSAGGSLY